MRKAFCLVQLRHHYYVQYHKDRSLGRYCSFCTRQTSLDLLKICNCIPTSTRTTIKICGFCAPAEAPDLQQHISTCVDRVSEYASKLLDDNDAETRCLKNGTGGYHISRTL